MLMPQTAFREASTGESAGKHLAGLRVESEQ
jgi:hypothetical protein